VKDVSSKIRPFLVSFDLATCLQSQRGGRNKPVNPFALVAAYYKRPPLSAFPRMIGRSAFAMICFLLASCVVVPRQQGVHGRVPGLIKSSSVVVNVYATVEGRHGQLIRNLNKDDFELTDNAVPQKINYFSQETDVPLSLGIALDTSASQAHILSTEQRAADKFLGSVLRTGDQAFVMSFDADVKLLQDFTSTPSELAQAVDTAEINQTGKSILRVNAASDTGGTHLFDAVYLASSELMKSRHGREVLVLVTDGEDQGSKINLQKAMEAAEQANVIVYSIIVNDPEFYSIMGSSYHGYARVRKLASLTGGRTIRVQSVNQVGQAFDQIERELRSQYRLGYSPPSLRHDGSFRRIRVKIRGHNYTIRARSGYYDVSGEPTKAASRLQ
jgi:VWFA-related protein